MTLKSSIKEAVSKHFWDIDFSDFSEENIDDIESFLDIDSLVDKMTEMLSEKILTFKSHSSIVKSEEGVQFGPSYICPSCYRQFGEWSHNGVSHDPRILENGRKIIVVDDL